MTVPPAICWHGLLQDCKPEELRLVRSPRRHPLGTNSNYGLVVLGTGLVNFEVRTPGVTSSVTSVT